MLSLFWTVKKLESFCLLLTRQCYCGALILAYLGLDWWRSLLCIPSPMSLWTYLEYVVQLLVITTWLTLFLTRHQVRRYKKTILTGVLLGPPFRNTDFALIFFFGACVNFLCEWAATVAAAAAARRFKKLNFKPPVDVDAWDMEVLYMWWYWCTCYRASASTTRTKCTVGWLSNQTHTIICDSVKGGTAIQIFGGPDR